MSSACPRPSALQTQPLGLADAVSRTRHSSARSLLPSRGFHALAIALPTLWAGSHLPTSEALLRGPRVVGVWDAARAGVGGGIGVPGRRSSAILSLSAILAATLAEPGWGTGLWLTEPCRRTPGSLATPSPPPTHTPARTASRSRAGLGQSGVVHRREETTGPAAALTCVQGPPRPRRTPTAGGCRARGAHVVLAARPLGFLRQPPRGDHHPFPFVH